MNLAISVVSLLSLSTNPEFHFLTPSDDVIALAKRLGVKLQLVPLAGWSGCTGWRDNLPVLYEGPWNRTLDGLQRLPEGRRHSLWERTLIRVLFQSKTTSQALRASDGVNGLRHIVHTIEELETQRTTYDGRKRPLPLLELGPRVDLSVERLVHLCKETGLRLVYDTNHFPECFGSEAHMAISKLAPFVEVIHLNFSEDQLISFCEGTVLRELKYLRDLYVANPAVAGLIHVLEYSPRHKLFEPWDKECFANDLCNAIRSLHANEWRWKDTAFTFDDQYACFGRSPTAQWERMNSEIGGS